jgi:hypothetical protein
LWTTIYKGGPSILKKKIAKERNLFLCYPDEGEDMDPDEPYDYLLDAIEYDGLWWHFDMRQQLWRTWTDRMCWGAELGLGHW